MRCSVRPENTGLSLRTVSIPLEDAKVGTTLAVRKSYVVSNPKEVAGYCRAMTKGLVFAMTNRAAAIRLFWEEFPTGSLPTWMMPRRSRTACTSLSRKGVQDQPDSARLGEFINTNWQNTHEAHVKLGTLKGAGTPNYSLTEQFIAACNDFDRAAIVAQAKAAL